MGYDDKWPWVEMHATQQARRLPPEIQMPASSALEQRCFDVSKKVEAGSGPRPRSIFSSLCDMTDDLSEHDTTRHCLSDLKRRIGVRDVDAECPSSCKNKWHPFAELVVQILRQDPLPHCLVKRGTYDCKNALRDTTAATQGRRYIAVATGPQRGPPVARSIESEESMGRRIAFEAEKKKPSPSNRTKMPR